MTINLLSIIGRYVDCFLFIFFWQLSGHTRWNREFYAWLPHSMTAFSMMSTAIFSFAAVLDTDKMNNWQTPLFHCPVNMVEYYLSKITSMLFDYLVSILVVFTVGHFVRGDDLAIGNCIGAASLLVVGSISL